MGPARRCLVAHAAATNEFGWLQALFKQEEDVTILGAGLLQRDVTGRHALDYAVASGHVPTLQLLLQAIWASVPPRGRAQLMETPHDGVPCFLLEVAPK